MELNLKKPIIFFDIETTGINIAKDRIVEISYIKVLPGGQEETETIRVNPTIPISEEASSIHGITNEDVKDCPTFPEIAKDIAKIFQGCDLAGYNSNNFDIPMLAEEFLRAEVDIDLKKHRFIDVKVIFHKMEQRTLSAAYTFYCNKELECAHSAQADTEATYEILKAQLDRYNGKTCKNPKGEESEPLSNDIDVLSRFSSHNKNVDFAGRFVYDNKGRETINFGKYKGMPVQEVLEKDPGYFGWMMKSDFPLYTKKVLTNIKLRMKNTL
jgi:DNA polymerase-3 subunit epsilon